jgi:hypothetical protein
MRRRIFRATVSGALVMAGLGLTTQPTVVGEYKAQHGEAGKDSYYSVMILQLKEDGKMSSTLTMADPVNPSKTIDKKVEGSWTQSGNAVKVTADTLDGQPVETNNPRKTLTLTIIDGGKQLSSDGGPQFVRQ